METAGLQDKRLPAILFFVAHLVPRLVPQRDLQNPEIARAPIGRGTSKTSICGRSEHLLVVFHSAPTSKGPSLANNLIA